MNESKRAKSKLIKEILVLVIVAVLILVIVVFKNGLPGSTKTTTKVQIKPLNTNFDTTPLDKLGQRDTNYPTVTPNNLGKTDPFSP